MVLSSGCPDHAISGAGVHFIHGQGNLPYRKVSAHDQPMDKVERTARDIGRRLRSARLGAGLTLADVAARAGVSEGFLSKLERGHSNASIANLLQLTDAVGLGLDELFGGGTTPARTRLSVHRGQAPEFQEVAATGYLWRSLGGGGPLDRLEVFHLVFPAKARMETMVSHPGQEHCYVLSGEVRFFAGDEQFRLKAGDGIFIDSQQPHRAENAGRRKAHMLMAVTKSAETADAADWWRLASFVQTKEPQR
jgi:transcriptional regulator with XRE-family HTH domain